MPTKRCPPGKIKNPKTGRCSKGAKTKRDVTWHRNKTKAMNTLRKKHLTPLQKKMIADPGYAAANPREVYHTMKKTEKVMGSYAKYRKKYGG